MRMLLIFVLGLFLPASLCAQTTASASAPSGGNPDNQGSLADLLVPHDGVVAKVNQEIILGNEVYKKIEHELNALSDTYANDKAMYTKKATELWKKTLREMIEDKVMLAAATAEGIKVTDKEVDKEIDSTIKKEGSKEKLEKKLAQVGINWDQYRERVKTEIIQRELILTKLGFRQKKVDPNTKMPLDSFVTPSEVQRYFAENKKSFYDAEKVKSRQIVMPFDAATKAETKAEAESVLKQIQHGADMSLLALWYSKVKQGEGGLWNFTERGTFPKEVDDVLFALKKGELGPIVETKDSFVIVRCEDRTEAKQRELGEDEVQDEIRRTIQNDKVNQNIDRVKKELVKAAYIEPSDIFEKP